MTLTTCDSVTPPPSFGRLEYFLAHFLGHTGRRSLEDCGCMLVSGSRGFAGGSRALEGHPCDCRLAPRFCRVPSLPMCGGQTAGEHGLNLSLGAETTHPPSPPQPATQRKTPTNQTSRKLGAHAWPPPPTPPVSALVCLPTYSAFL